MYIFQSLFLFEINNFFLSYSYLHSKCIDYSPRLHLWLHHNYHSGYQQMDHCHSIPYLDYNAQHISLIIIKPYQNLYLCAILLKLSMAHNVTSSSSSKVASRLCNRDALCSILHIKIVLTYKLRQSHSGESLCCLNALSLIHCAC